MLARLNLFCLPAECICWISNAPCTGLSLGAADATDAAAADRRAEAAVATKAAHVTHVAVLVTVAARRTGEENLEQRKDTYLACII